MTTEEIRAELNMRRGLRAEVVEILLRTRRWAARFFSAVWAAVLVPWLLEDDMEMMVYKGRRN
jgi:hypothetical protein